MNYDIQIIPHLSFSTPQALLYKVVSPLKQFPAQGNRTALEILQNCLLFTKPGVARAIL